MKKGILQIVLFLAAVFSICFAVVACEDGTEKTSENAAITINVPEEVTFGYGEEVTVPPATATNEAGSEYPVNFVVYDKDKVLVETDGQVFTAEDMRGYTVKYFLTVDGVEYTARTNIVITPSDIAITMTDLNTVSVEGEKVRIGTPVTEHEKLVFLTYEVTYEGENVKVTGNTFVTERAGEYTVKVTAEDEFGCSGNYIYVVECLGEEQNRGVIERFDENWIPAAKEVYTVVSTAEEKIPSYNGKEAYVGKIDQTSEDYIYLYCNPMFNKEYYQSLAEQGFESMSFWLYVKSENNVPHTLEQHFTRGSYTAVTVPNSIHTVQPNTWTLIDLPLTTPSENDFQRSFIDAYDYLKEQINWFCHLNNSRQWGGGTGGDTVTLYVSDIYATKTVDKSDLTINSSLTEGIELGQTVDFNDYIAGYDALITLQYGNTTEIADGNFTFTFDGEYKLTAQVVDGCYRTDPIVTQFDVSSDYVLDCDFDGLYLSANGTCDLSGLGITVTDAEGSPVSIGSADYEVKYRDKIIENNDGVFTYSEAGTYDIFLTVCIEDGGMEYYIVREYPVSLSLDGEVIYSDVSDPQNVWQWDYGNAKSNEKHTYETETVGNLTAEMLAFKQWNQHVNLQIIPSYGISYYEKLAQQGASLMFEYYIDSSLFTTRAVQGVGGNEINVTTKVWHTMEIPMSNIVGNFDKLQGMQQGAADFKNLIFVWLDDANATFYMTEPRVEVMSLSADTQSNRFSNDGTFEFADLNVRAENGSVLSEVIYTVYRNGVPVESTETGFTYTEEGEYVIFIEAKIAGGNHYFRLSASYAVYLTLDEAYAFIDLNNGDALTKWAPEWSANNSVKGGYVFENYTVGEKTADMYKITMYDMQLELKVLPDFTKDELQELADLGAVLKFSYYFECPVDGWHEHDTTIFPGTAKKCEGGKWYEGEISLQDIVDVYEDFSSEDRGAYLINAWMKCDNHSEDDTLLYMTMPLIVVPAE